MDQIRRVHAAIPFALVSFFGTLGALHMLTADHYHDPAPGIFYLHKFPTLAIALAVAGFSALLCCFIVPGRSRHWVFQTIGGTFLAAAIGPFLFFLLMEWRVAMMGALGGLIIAVPVIPSYLIVIGALRGLNRSRPNSAAYRATLRRIAGATAIAVLLQLVVWWNAHLIEMLGPTFSIIALLTAFVSLDLLAMRRARSIDLAQLTERGAHSPPIDDRTSVIDFGIGDVERESIETDRDSDCGPYRAVRRTKMILRGDFDSLRRQLSSGVWVHSLGIALALIAFVLTLHS